MENIQIQHIEDRDYYQGLPLEQAFDRVLSGDAAVTSDYAINKFYTTGQTDLAIFHVNENTGDPSDYSLKMRLVDAGLEWLAANSGRDMLKIYNTILNAPGNQVIVSTNDFIKPSEVLFTTDHFVIARMPEDYDMILIRPDDNIIDLAKQHPTQVILQIARVSYVAAEVAYNRINKWTPGRAEAFVKSILLEITGTQNTQNSNSTEFWIPPLVLGN